MSISLKNANRFAMLFLALTVSIIHSQQPDRPSQTEPPSELAPIPAPGKLIDVGGRRIHLNCTGSGSPTVIAESGSGADSTAWALVQPKVSRFTRFCSYDRAGYAWSDDGPTVDTVAQTEDDLHLLLRTADIRPPYVLIGASLGGLFVQAYQRRYPDEVAGLVLDDAANDEGFRISADKLLIDMSAQEVFDARSSYLRTAKPVARPTALEEPEDRLPKSLQAARLWSQRKLVWTHQDFATSESWREEFIALRQRRLDDHKPLDNLPLIVLARTEDTGKYAEQLKDNATKYSLQSRQGRLIMVPKSGHEIHLYQPDVVTQAIRDVLTAVPRSTPPSR